jgi:hypothetical protein
LSLRLGATLCWACHHASFTEDELRAAERVAHQREIADAVRRAADRLSGTRAEALRARALLVHTADSTEQVAELLVEVEALGIKLENGGTLPTLTGAGSESHRQAMAWIASRFRRPLR